MSATTASPPPPVTERTPWLSSLPHLHRLILRWVFILLVTAVAFHRSLLSLVDTTRQGGMNSYVWVVLVAAALAAIGVARRNRTELPIHDRQTDVIVAIMGLVLALLLHGVLLGRYALYFHLLRLDLLAMWTFVLSACIALFGLRPVTRFGWVWLLLLAVFPLPYHLVVIVLGGTHVAAGLGTLLIAATATAIAVGRHWGRGVVGASVSLALGLLTLAVLRIGLPSAPLLVYQFVPAVTAICLSSVTLYLLARRDKPKRLLDRKVEPLAAAQVWSALPVVLAVGVGLSLIPLPAAGLAPTARVDALRFDRSPTVPPGWHVTDTRDYPWVRRLYGEGAHLLRQQMVADKGDPRFDKRGAPRALAIDTTVTHRPFALSTFPARMIYNVSGIRQSDNQLVDLGYGVTGDLFTAVDDKLLVTWEGMQFTWTTGTVEQRVLVISVDNHDDDAPFPQPTGGLLPTLNSMFTVLFRGNTAASDRDPTIKDAVLLTEFSRALVRSQLAPLGVQP